tara:strand:- start:255 stop:1415 length:1161 start_codon:yes stop_codon:yes gene_type:complete
MIIVSYLTENFILETLKYKDSRLKIFLEELCILNEHLFLVCEPKWNWASIKKKKPKDIKQTNLTLWATYLRILKGLGRLKDHQFIKDYYKEKDIDKGLDRERFIKNSFKGKVFYLSFKDFYIKKSYLKMESLGKDLEEIAFKIKILLKENIEPTLNIKNLEDRENIFYDKIGGFCCFYNSLIWIDRYIVDNKKFNPTIFLKTPSRLLNGSKIENLIIITSDPYANKSKYQGFRNKQDCIRDYLNSLKEAIYPNHIDIHLFLLIPKELKSIHSRFISWTSLPADDVFNFSSLKGLKDQIKLAIQPDKGAGYFEEDSEEGFSAQFSYPSAKTVNKHLSKIIKSSPKKNLSNKEDIEDASYEYWVQENYPKDRGWIYYKDIFKKAKVDT